MSTELDKIVSRNNREARRLELLNMELQFYHDLGWALGVDALKDYIGLRACVKDPVSIREDLTVARQAFGIPLAVPELNERCECGDLRTRHHDTLLESGHGGCKACSDCPQFTWTEFVS